MASLRPAMSNIKGSDSTSLSMSSLGRSVRNWAAMSSSFFVSKPRTKYGCLIARTDTLAPGKINFSWMREVATLSMLVTREVMVSGLMAAIWIGCLVRVSVAG